MTKVINLDDVTLSPATVAAWQEVTKRIADALAQISAMRGGEKFTIPDEQGCVNDDETLTIFVSVPGIIPEASLVVPANQWAWAS